jgi:predicted GNAT family acetyltransferase
MPPDVRHDAASNRFVVETEQGSAQLVYERASRRFIVVHTEVPEALGGRGIGGQLVRAAVQHARADGLTVVPWCPFARRWLGEHADEVAGVEVDWDDRPPSR